jgi:hypothetical protein
MKARSLVVFKPLVAAAALCMGAAHAAPPGAPNLGATLGSTLGSLGAAGTHPLPSLVQDGGGNGDSPLNPFAQGSFLHHNPAGHLAFDTVNGIRRAAPDGLIPVNSERPDLPGLRKDATSRLVHDLELYETTERTLDALSIGDGSDHDGGFLGAADSSTLGTDDHRDPGDNGFLGVADSSTLGTD